MEDASSPKAVRIERESEEPVHLTLYSDATYSFGRDRSNTVTFSNDSISRHHGVLSCDANGRWLFRDQRSSNGSFLSEGARSADVEEAERMLPSRDYEVRVGHAVVLANSAARVVFLRELPLDTAKVTPSRASAVFEETVKAHARHRMPIFLLGPTGAGKTWAARRIHELSRVPGNFVLIDCGALPRDHNSLRSELLGHVRGAFSDAKEHRLGKIFHADGGTLFLDEVESLAPEGQALLLNLIEGTGDFAPLGQAPDAALKRPQFRLVSASKVPLRRSGLREDLANRLARGGAIVIPTLDERRDDIPELVRSIVAMMKAELQLDAHFEPAAIKALKDAHWPGHVRQLDGVVRTLVELEQSHHVDASVTATGQFRRVEGALVRDAPREPLIVSARAVAEHLEAQRAAWGEAEVPSSSNQPTTATRKPRDLTRDQLERLLADNGSNLTRSAKSLGVAINTLKVYLRKHGLRDG